MRIVSCVPSLSELIAYFDQSLLVGRTKFCIHPSEIKQVGTVGGTKNLAIDSILALQPDWIVTAKEENEKEQVLALGQRAEVSTFDIKNVNEALESILLIGQKMGYIKKAKNLINNISEGKEKYNKQPLGTAAYFIWNQPMMVAGGDTFIGAMMVEAGFENIFDARKRYPVVTEAELKEIQPQYILLSSEPYRFTQKHLHQFSMVFPQSQVVLVDGTYFSWYGSRLANAWDYFKQMRTTLRTHSN